MDKLKVIVGLCFLALIMSFSIFSYFHVSEVEGVVTEKYNKRKGDSDHFYVVVQEKNEDEKVLVNKDSLLMLKWDSADIQAKVHEGKKYKVKMRGFRVPIFSMYPNIDTIQEVK
ncbi:putative membrane protein [Bacillus phage vB_BspM_MarvelLand]|uniref:Uncharacterized protein n=1 Tax=Bacillus phage TsarBomba TaxID=1690456 RepID=A0A0K2D0G5_9CAUD|nr:secreted protein [Bacillus phage TsarBomba]ALA13086.1 hypothetical protein TSARBOMBA_221 [Bacillus phage TsarBomba]QEG13630.1 putative membrane protein [Bacillus phage vB_BspM_MarvelLand]